MYTLGRRRFTRTLLDDVHKKLLLHERRMEANPTITPAAPGLASSPRPTTYDTRRTGNLYTMVVWSFSDLDTFKKNKIAGVSYILQTRQHLQHSSLGREYYKEDLTISNKSRPRIVPSYHCCIGSSSSLSESPSVSPAPSSELVSLPSTSVSKFIS
jgi:hypothetical protein